MSVINHDPAPYTRNTRLYLVTSRDGNDSVNIRFGSARFSENNQTMAYIDDGVASCRAGADDGMLVKIVHST